MTMPIGAQVAEIMSEEPTVFSERIIKLQTPKNFRHTQSEEIRMTYIDGEVRKVVYDFEKRAAVNVDGFEHNNPFFRFKLRFYPQGYPTLIGKKSPKQLQQECVSQAETSKQMDSKCMPDLISALERACDAEENKNKPWVKKDIQKIINQLTQLKSGKSK